jgi:hypothetical protein
MDTKDLRNRDRDDDEQQRCWRLRERLEIIKLVLWMIFEAISDVIKHGGLGPGVSDKRTPGP